MKRFTIICLLSTLVAFAANAQRYTDLEITLMSPNAGDTVWTKKQFDIGASIKNLGKDTVWSQHYIAFQLIFDGNPISFDFGNGFQDYIEMTGTAYRTPLYKMPVVLSTLLQHAAYYALPSAAF